MNICDFYAFYILISIIDEVIDLALLGTLTHTCDQRQKKIQLYWALCHCPISFYVSPSFTKSVRKTKKKIFWHKIRLLDIGIINGIICCLCVKYSAALSHHRLRVSSFSLSVAAFLSHFVCFLFVEWFAVRCFKFIHRQLREISYIHT